MSTKTLPTKVSKAEAKRLMAEIVAEAGEDYVFYEPCQYFADDGQPACIVGRFFHKLGIERSDLPQLSRSAGPINTSLIIDDMLPDTSKKIRNALKVAQDRQDRRRPYGEALSAFNGNLDR